MTENYGSLSLKNKKYYDIFAYILRYQFQSRFKSGMKNKLYDFYKATELKIVNFAHRFGSLRLRTQSLWILLFLLFVILCNLQFIAKGGDAIHKWFMVRLYLEHGTFFPIQPDHHLLRWGLMWPVIGVCKLLGASIYCYR